MCDLSFIGINWNQLLTLYLIFELNNLMFFCRYGDFRLINIPHLREVMPLTMENFYKNIKQSSKAAAEQLRYQWLPEVCEIVDSHRETVEQWMPQDSVSFKLSWKTSLWLEKWIPHDSVNFRIKIKSWKSINCHRIQLVSEWSVLKSWKPVMETWETEDKGKQDRYKLLF